MLELSATAAPFVKTTVPPVFTTGVNRERVFVSALSEVRVHVERPEASETEQTP